MDNCTWKLRVDVLVTPIYHQHELFCVALSSHHLLFFSNKFSSIYLSFSHFLVTFGFVILWYHLLSVQLPYSQRECSAMATTYYLQSCQWVRYGAEISSLIKIWCAELSKESDSPEPPAIFTRPAVLFHIGYDTHINSLLTVSSDALLNLQISQHLGKYF